MENQFMDTQNAGLTALPQKKMWLPFIALALDFAPVLFISLAVLHQMFVSLLLIGIFSPIFGIVLGIVALSQERKRIGAVGVIISVTAIALPIVFVLTVILLLRTGAFVIGM